MAPLGEPRTTRYAGVFLLYAALARVALWGVFRQLAATTGPARWYGWAHTVAAIVCGFALRFRSIEDRKNALRADPGVLLGTAQAPTVLVLRQKIKALAESVDPVALARALFRRYVALEPVSEGVYDVDGHFCPYYGQHPTPQGWNPHRRLAVPGHTDVSLHDARGRVLVLHLAAALTGVNHSFPWATIRIPAGNLIVADPPLNDSLGPRQPRDGGGDSPGPPAGPTRAFLRASSGHTINGATKGGSVTVTGSSQGSVQLWPVPWLISQALSSTYVAGEHRLYLERNCRLSESPAHGTRRKSRGACQCQGAEQSARVRPSGKTSAKVQAAFHECSWFVAL